MYGLPQAGRISNDALVKHLEPYGYHPSRKTLGLWIHNIQPIKFTLLVNDFGLKDSGKDNSLHLKEVLEDKNKATTVWEGKLYIGISLRCDHKKAQSNFQYQDMYVQHYTHPNTKKTKYPRTRHTYVHKPSMEKQSDAIRKIIS